MTVDKVQLGVPYTDTKPAQPYGYEHPRFVIVLRKIGDNASWRLSERPSIWSQNYDVKINRQFDESESDREPIRYGRHNTWLF